MATYKVEYSESWENKHNLTKEGVIDELTRWYQNDENWGNVLVTNTETKEYETYFRDAQMDVVKDLTV